MRILAVDLGDKRVGLAVSDTSGIIATPKSGFNFKNICYSLDYISNISDELEVNLILLGMPFLLSGAYGEQAKKVKKFATELRKKVSIFSQYNSIKVVKYCTHNLCTGWAAISYKMVILK